MAHISALSGPFPCNWCGFASVHPDNCPNNWLTNMLPQYRANTLAYTKPSDGEATPQEDAK